MLDGVMRRMLDPGLDATGVRLAALGIRADHVTLLGLSFGLACAGAIVLGQFVLAIVLLGLSRLADGLDGAVARATSKTDFGGYLDIACDFTFYGVVPLAFALHAPADNAIPAAVLLAAFYINGTTFLGFAIAAERLGLSTEERGSKSLYFTEGLFEGTETILFFLAMMLWPQAFAVLAYTFALGCVVTAGGRMLRAWNSLRGRVAKDP